VSSEDKKESGENKSGQGRGSVVQEFMKEVVDPFRSLATSPRAMWALYLSYLLEGMVYFGILTVLGKYLSEDVGLSDLHAGWVYSGFTGGITLSMLFLGGVADKIGVRKALLISLAMMVAGRLFLGASGTFFQHGGGTLSPMFFFVVIGLAIVVVGYGMYQPAAYAGVKQFTDEKSSTMGYAMIYGLMNLGAFLSGIASPPIRQQAGIVGVYWFYVGATFLGFLTIAVLMTRRAVNAATLSVVNSEAEKNTSDDETESPSESGEDVPPKKQAGPQAKLFTAPFTLMTLAAVVAVAFLIFLAAVAPKTPAEEALAEAKGVLSKAASTLDSVKLGHGEPGKELGSLSTSLEELSKNMTPRDLPGDARVSAVLLRSFSHRLRRDAALLGSMPALLAGTYSPGSEETRTQKNRIRSLGILFMVSAYGMVSTVDQQVLDRLRLRMKKPEEEPIPLPDGATNDYLAVARMAPADLARELSRRVLRASAATKETKTAGATLLASIIASESKNLSWMAGALDKATSETDRKLLKNALKEDILHASVMLLKTLPPVLDKRSGGGASEATASGEQEGTSAPDKNNKKLAPVAAMAGAWLADEAGFVDKLSSLSPSAVEMPLQASLIGWGVRYGIVLLTAIVLIFLLGASLLKKRPDHPFHDGRFVFFIFILIPVQTLFAHNWLTLPYYIDRAFGGTTVGNNFEFFANINPILIFFLAPAVAALTARAKVYPMMIMGTLVMAIPTLLLALAPNPALLIAYILLMSVGEAMWQPRFLQWVAEIAPEGKTGLYMGIGQFPWFLTKVVTGLYSGWFLSQYCPMVGPQNTQMMWFIYAMIALATPLALWMAKGWMTSGTSATSMD